VSLPVDVSRALEQLLQAAEVDFVHVHEPFAPSAASAALRHSHALNVGTFHAPTERVVSTQVARRLVELLFGRLDGRTASFTATRDLVARYFPGDYRVIHPGADLAERPVSNGGEIVDIVYSVEEDRAGLRLFLRALRKLPVALPWRATVWSREREAGLGLPLSRRLRDRVRFSGPADGSEAQYLAAADVVVAASTGAAPAPQLLFRAMAGGAVPVAARLPTYEEALLEGDRGLLFEPRDSETLAHQLERLIRDRELLGSFHDRVQRDRRELDWARTAERFEELYHDIAGRRKRADGAAAVRKRLQSRELIDVDLHMHTDHSPDCATPVDVLLETAKARGLGAIAVTDHNVISGAHEARDRANGIKVIVAEEVKTADQGEVIGLFIEEHIPRGMTLEETIAEIQRQGGLVYVPHPFDRMHAVPDYEHLLNVLDDVDAIEVFNARVAVPSFNEEAVKFARKYRIPAGAGSDSHVPQGLGSVRIRMRDFEGPEEFLESLREADIIRRPKSLLYVQTLKFLQTKAPGARKRRSSGKR
jgi:glycosyltransferase involved in cell wall biosynthesis/histidinol phosphatase-like PHP family hydrolase